MGPVLAVAVVVAGVLAWLAIEIMKVRKAVEVIIGSDLGRAVLGRGV